MWKIQQKLQKNVHIWIATASPWGFVGICTLCTLLLFSSEESGQEVGLCSVLLESSTFLLKWDHLTTCSKNPSNASPVSGGWVNGNTYPVFITVYLGVLKWVQCLFMVSCVESLRTGNLIFQSKLQQGSKL